MQFCFIEKKTKNLLGVKIPSALTDIGMGQFTKTIVHENLK